MNTLEMLKKINFAKHLKKLETKYKNKKILLYGMNEEFFTIIQNFDLSNLNTFFHMDYPQSSKIEAINN